MLFDKNAIKYRAGERKHLGKSKQIHSDSTSPLKAANVHETTKVTSAQSEKSRVSVGHCPNACHRERASGAAAGTFEIVKAAATQPEQTSSLEMSKKAARSCWRSSQTCIFNVGERAKSDSVFFFNFLFAKNAFLFQILNHFLTFQKTYLQVG